jgi:hypothetical protein
MSSNREAVAAKGSRRKNVIVYGIHRYRRATEEEADTLPLSDLWVLEPVEGAIYRAESQATVEMRIAAGREHHQHGYVLKPLAVTLDEAIELEEKRKYQEQRRAAGLPVGDEGE